MKVLILLVAFLFFMFALLVCLALVKISLMQVKTEEKLEKIVRKETATE